MHIHPSGAQVDSAAALEQDIKRTRHELGETVEALVAKTDVKARAQHRGAEVAGKLRQRARGAMQHARSGAHGVTERVTGHGAAITSDNRARGGVAAAALGALMLVWLTARRRRRR